MSSPLAPSAADVRSPARIWLAVCLAMLSAAVVLRARVDWTPIGDNALTRMWTAAVGGAHTPLVGGDARYGWNHLGPWLFYLYAVPYRVLGGSSRGLLVAAGAINVGCLWLIVRATRAVAGNCFAAVLCAAAIVSLLMARGPRLVDPWNPYIAQLILLVAIVSCWAVLTAHTVWCASLLGAASLAVQAHITFLAPSVCLVLVAIVGLWWFKTRPTTWQLVACAAVLAVAWTPTMLDLVLPGHHNAWHVARFFATSPPTGHNIKIGVRVVLRETGLRTDWLGGRPPLQTFTQTFNGRLGLAPGLALVAAGWTGAHAVRRRDRTAVTLIVILVGLTIVAVAEMSTSTGPLYPYLFGWVSLVGLLALISPALIIESRLSTAASQRALTGAAITSIGAAVILLVTSINAAPPRSPLEQRSDAQRVSEAAATAATVLDPHQHYRLIHGADTYNSIYELGVVSELRRRHINVVVDPGGQVLFGRHMVDPNAASYPAVEVVAPFLAPVPGTTPIVVSDPLTRAERHHERELTRLLTTTYVHQGYTNAAELINSNDSDNVGLAAFVSSPTTDATLQELGELRRKGRPFAIVVINLTPTPGRHAPS